MICTSLFLHSISISVSQWLSLSIFLYLFSASVTLVLFCLSASLSNSCSLYLLACEWLFSVSLFIHPRPPSLTHSPAVPLSLSLSLSLPVSLSLSLSLSPSLSLSLSLSLVRTLSLSLSTASRPLVSRLLLSIEQHDATHASNPPHQQLPTRFIQLNNHKPWSIHLCAGDANSKESCHRKPVFPSLLCACYTCNRLQRLFGGKNIDRRASTLLKRASFETYVRRPLCFWFSVVSHLIGWRKKQRTACIRTTSCGSAMRHVAVVPPSKGRSNADFGVCNVSQRGTTDKMCTGALVPTSKVRIVYHRKCCINTTCPG